MEGWLNNNQSQLLEILFAQQAIDYPPTDSLYLDYAIQES